MTENIVNLFAPQEQQVELIIEGASFMRTWHGPVQASLLWQVGWTEINLTQSFEDAAADLTTPLDVVDETTGKPFGELLDMDSIQQRDSRNSDNHAYYFALNDRESAKILCRMLDNEQPKMTKSSKPFSWREQQVYRIVAPVQDAVHLDDDAKKKFEAEAQVYEVTVKAIQKNSGSWHQFHGILLPSMVAAFAKLSGIECPAYEVAGLTDVAPGDFIATDVVQTDLIGNTDIGPTESACYRMRSAIWNALGETNVKASLPIGTDARRNVTESQQLSQALQVCLQPWGKMVYTSIRLAADPEVAAAYDTDHGVVRPTLPVVTAFHLNKADCEAFYKAEHAAILAAAGMESTGKDAASKGGGDAKSDAPYPVPASWGESMADDWLDAVKELAPDLKGKPVAAQKRVLKKMEAQDILQDTLGATFEEVFATVEYLNEGDWQ